MYIIYSLYVAYICGITFGIRGDTMKHIILSSDGTGNSGGKKYNTNVWNLHTAIDRNDYEKGDCDAVQQVTFYDDGVGTDQMKWLKLLGGAVGLGLAINVKELYTFLVYNYEEGDKIYLFGFSRGGFTIRLLADIICTIGILKLDHAQYIDDHAVKCAVNGVYRRLRKENFRFQWFDSKSLLRNFIELCIKQLICIPSSLEPYGISQTNDSKTRKNSAYKPEIEFIGIWDTVEAYAVPSRYWGTFIDKYIYRFQSSTKVVDARIKKICHVLSIDDERQVFHPVLWNEKNTQQDKHCDESSRVEQVWFSGVHANVGGGYPKQGLAWTSLSWMMEKAKQSGLRFAKEDHEQYIENCDYNDHLYDSRAGLASFYGYEPRDIGEISANYQCNETLIHISTLQRILYRTRGYAPTNLPKKFKVIDAQPFSFEQQYKIDELTRKIQARLSEQNVLDKHKKGIQFRIWQQRIVSMSLLVGLVVSALIHLWVGTFANELWLAPFYITALMMFVFWVINWQLRKNLYQSAREFWSASIADDDWQVVKEYRFSGDQYELKTYPEVKQHVEVNFNSINIGSGFFMGR